MALGEERVQMVRETYLSEARKYLNMGIVINPDLQDAEKLAEYLMKKDGIDLSKIQTGEQQIQDLWRNKNNL
jgi:hypothetical protein